MDGWVLSAGVVWSHCCFLTDLCKLCRHGETVIFVCCRRFRVRRRAMRPLPTELNEGVTTATSPSSPMSAREGERGR